MTPSPLPYLANEALQAVSRKRTLIAGEASSTDKESIRIQGSSSYYDK